MKKKVLMILCAILCTFSVISFVIADSGFDFEYDSGGSSNSSSGFSSSRSSHSSSDSYSSSNSKGSRGPTDPMATFIVIIVPFGMCSTLMIFILIYFIQKNKKYYINLRKIYDVNYKAIEDEEINKLIPSFNKKEFLDKTYKIYIHLQKAWMNFKLDDVRNTLTNELYNMYKSQLDTLRAKELKNIMKDFELVDINVMDIYKVNEYLEIKVKLVIKQKDYIININSKKVVRGSSMIKNLVVYELNFVKRDIPNKIKLCPSCGAKVDFNTSTICNNCGNILVSDNNTDWVLSNKKIISQEKLWRD